MFNSEEEYNKVMLDLANLILKYKKEGNMEILEEGCYSCKGIGEIDGEICPVCQGHGVTFRYKDITEEQEIILWDFVNQLFDEEA